MKFTYLGTSSCEGTPAVFCNCKTCQKARKLGGKNIRTRSQSLINNDLLIDFPADTLYHFHKNKIEGHKIKYLLLTHSHSDHLYVSDIFYRGGPRAKGMEVETLHLYCGKGAYDKVAARGEPMNIEMHLVAPFDTFTVGDYRVTALPARHMPGDGALIYLIEGDKTLLYAHDTGYFYDEIFDYLAKNGIKLDMATYDCAYVDRPVSDEGTHMGIENIRRVVARLTELGVATGETLHCINHFSHGADSLQASLEEMVREDGYLVAYDGRVVEL